METALSTAATFLGENPNSNHQFVNMTKPFILSSKASRGKHRSALALRISQREVRFTRTQAPNGEHNVKNFF